MTKQPNFKHDKPMFPWVVVAPDGLRWLGLAMNEHHAWQFALGWPDQKEIQDYKEQLGWYASEATCTWKRDPVLPQRLCEDSQVKGATHEAAHGIKEQHMKPPTALRSNT